MSVIDLAEQSNDLIQQQHRIFLNFRTIRDTYEHEKEEARQRLKRDKGEAEVAWNHAQSLVNTELEQIRQMRDTTLDAVASSPWKDKVGGGISQAVLTGPSENSAQEMEKYRTIAYQAHQEITTFLRSDKSPSSVNKTSGCLALVVAGVCCSIFGGISSAAGPNGGGIGVLGFLIALGLGIVIYVVRINNPASKLKNAVATLNNAISNTEGILNQRLKGPQEAYQSQINQAQARFTETMRQLEQEWPRQLAGIQPAFATFNRQVTTSFMGLPWDNPQWEQWEPYQSITPFTRLGTLTAHRDLPTVPALVACPGNENILFKAAGIGKEQAIAAVQSLMLRLLATQPPGKARFTLIDPIGLGQNVSTFMQLSDDQEDLVGSKAWSESRYIDKELADLSEHMGNIIQKYLRGQYKTIEEYNQQAGEVAEPYRILVVIGFPVKFSSEAAGRLVEIATNGPKCGVSTVVILDTEQPLPYGFNISDLEQVSTVLGWDGQRFTWQDADFEDCQLNLDAPPSLELFNLLLKEVGKQAQINSEVRVPFERVMPPQDAWWTGDSRSGISVALGRKGATRLQTLDLGKGMAQHVLVVGKTGSGKTTLLHTLITNLAFIYSPTEVELYLVDFKTVGFTAYANKLPHARVVAVQSEREFGLSVLLGLDSELERRKNLFSSAGVQDIAQYRNLHNSQLPRILLLVDEFQEFFTVDDDIAQKAALFLDRLVRQGRAFGIHVMLGSQTLAGAYTLPRATIGQMAVRIALQCEESDSRLVLSDDNPAARLLSRPGEAIYNAANGLVEGNNPFQCAWLSDEELDEYLLRIQRFAQQPKLQKYIPSWKQIVFNGQANADVERNTALTAVLAASSWPAPQKVVTAWLGDPIAIKDPTSVQFRAQAGNNLLIVGQQEEAALGMMITALISLAAQYVPGTANFYVADFSPADVAHAGLFEKIVQNIPHDVRFVERRAMLRIISELADVVKERVEHQEISHRSIYLLIYGLQRARDIRPEEDFGYSSFMGGEAAPPSPAKQFATIVREGPELDIHTLAWCDTLVNVNRSVERGVLRDFELRVALQMSQDDSINFIESPAASKLGQFGQYRALLLNEETQVLEKFRPYGVPSQGWLQKAISGLYRGN